MPAGFAEGGAINAFKAIGANGAAFAARIAAFGADIRAEFAKRAVFTHVCTIGAVIAAVFANHIGAVFAGMAVIANVAAFAAALAAVFTYFRRAIIT